jgi:hypothetical protein
VQASPPARNAGKVLLGDIANSIAQGGPITQVRRAALPSGETVEAKFIAGSPRVVYGKTERHGGTEEIIYAYLGSPGGLRLFDLGLRNLVRTVTGLEPYEVDGVSVTGKIVYMSSTIAVRVDLTDNSAFGYSYPVKALTLADDIIDALAAVEGMQLSPDGKALLVAYDETYTPPGSIVDGLGGYILADAETLAPLHTAYRMSFRPMVSCWAPDGRFFIATTKNTDDGDVPTLDTTTSTSDYVSAFDADGTLLASREIYAWPVTPSTGFSRTIHAMAADIDRKRLFVLSKRTHDSADTTLHVVNIDDDALPIVANVDVAGTSHDMQVSSGGKRLTLLHPGSEVSEYDITGTTPTLVARTSDPAFAGNPVSGLNSWGTDLLQLGVKSRFGQPPDKRRFLLDNGGVSATLYAFNAFADPPVFSYDFGGLAVRNRYRLANVGARPRTTP